MFRFSASARRHYFMLIIVIFIDDLSLSHRLDITELVSCPDPTQLGKGLLSALTNNMYMNTILPHSTSKKGSFITAYEYEFHPQLSGTNLQ